MVLDLGVHVRLLLLTLGRQQHLLLVMGNPEQGLWLGHTAVRVHDDIGKGEDGGRRR